MFLAIYSRWLLAIFFIFSSISIIPTTANAGLFSTISSFIFGNSLKQVESSATIDNSNSQIMPLLQDTMNFDSSQAVGGGDILISGNDALISADGPSGTLADIGNSSNTGQISRYMVRHGDSLSSIAKMFGVSKNTILWANNISTSDLKEGQILIILPVSGTIHNVVKGDTLGSIAKKYKADVGEIAQFNELDRNSPLAIGTQIIIPDGEGNVNVTSASATRLNKFKGGSGPDYQGYYIRPLIGGIRTQGLHGWNAVDIGTSVGTPILAAASGEIIIARSSGWNGGYGRYVVISHYNGTQTVYGHLSELFVSDGEIVYQGQVIGLSGNTGNSTGPHLHFEVRGAKNFLAN